MFSRIMMASQSPKKCKPEDMTSSEQNRIVQTSSDDDFVLSAKEEEKREDGSHRGRLSFHSNSQSSCNEAESKKEQKRKRFVLRESESLSLSERSTESSDTGSSASESSDSDLFDKEEESQPVVAKTVINRKIISTQPEKQVLSESIEDPASSRTQVACPQGVEDHSAFSSIQSVQAQVPSEGGGHLLVRPGL